MLSAGRAAPRPFVVDGRVRVRTALHLCPSVDHGAMDGVAGARFLDRIVTLLGGPHCCWRRRMHSAATIRETIDFLRSRHAILLRAAGPAIV